MSAGDVWMGWGEGALDSLSWLLTVYPDFKEEKLQAMAGDATTCMGTGVFMQKEILIGGQKYLIIIVYQPFPLKLKKIVAEKRGSSVVSQIK